MLVLPLRKEDYQVVAQWIRWGEGVALLFLMRDEAV